jgi:hypothetical protein
MTSPSIGITGTQHGPTVQQFAAVFAWVDRFRKRTDWLNHGDCVGVDAQFAGWWKDMGGWLRSHATPEAIVSASSCIIAMPREEAEQERGGTWLTVRYARKMGTPCLLVLPSGVIVKESWR